MNKKPKVKAKAKDKMTIIKVLGSEDSITKADIEKWRKIFAEKRMTVKEAVATGEVKADYFSPPDNDAWNYITLVRIGNENYAPSTEDLASWRDLFEDAKGDPDFKVFVWDAVGVSIKSIPIGEIVAVD